MMVHGVICVCDLSVCVVNWVCTYVYGDVGYEMYVCVCDVMCVLL